MNEIFNHRSDYLYSRDIICDIDGTLTNTTHRQQYISCAPKNWKAWNSAMHLDQPHEDIIWLVRLLHANGNRIILCSGREITERHVTIDWLKERIVPYDALYMRAEKDYRADDIIKIELLEQIRKDGFNPTIAIDDRQRVVNAWRKAGLRCLQVAPGDF